jgi:hypothetical protein
MPGPPSSTEQRKVAGIVHNGPHADAVSGAGVVRHCLQGVDNEVHDHLL